MNETPEFVPLNEKDVSIYSSSPKILFEGFSEKEVSFYIDLILRVEKHRPIFAIIQETVYDWTIRDYIKTLEEEHRLFTGLKERT
ncbi:MAG: DUF3783 domain-containing protein [bacterium]|nr:DUF3783 domain-containing protein [bacterium]